MIGKRIQKRGDKPTRRDLQKIQTRERVYRAAKELFAAKGYFETRSGDIAELAGVSHGSVFSHFKSKSEILEQLYRDCLLTQNARVKSHTFCCGRADERLCTLVDVLWNEATTNIKLGRAMFAQTWLWNTEREKEYQVITGEIRGIGERILLDGKEKGEISADIDVVAAMNILQAQYLDCLRRALIEPERAAGVKAKLKSVIKFICRS